MRRFCRTLAGDRRGGIEGLPLQLMIVILVATMGTAVIIGWMGNIETPNSISEVTVDQDCLEKGKNGYELTVRVYDQDNYPLKGATVLLSGLGVNIGGKTAYEQTGDDGSVRFKNIVMNFPGPTGILSITVTKPQYGEHTGTQILVIK